MKGQELPRPTLSEIQNWMSQVITNSTKSSTTEEGWSWVQEDENASRAERVGVYANAYLIRLIEILEEDFQSVHAVLGHANFSKLVVDYLKAYPSRSENVGELGREFSRYLETYSISAEIPYLSALASLEWSICESFWADDLPRLDFSKLQTLSEEKWV